MTSYEQKHEPGTREHIQDKVVVYLHHLVQNSGVPSLADTFGWYPLSCAVPGKSISRHKFMKNWTQNHFFRCGKLEHAINEQDVWQWPWAWYYTSSNNCCWDPMSSKNAIAYLGSKSLSFMYWYILLRKSLRTSGKLA